MYFLKIASRITEGGDVERVTQAPLLEETARRFPFSLSVALFRRFEELLPSPQVLRLAIFILDEIVLHV
jgi:hypothetical protein